MKKAAPFISEKTPLDNVEDMDQFVEALLTWEAESLEEKPPKLDDLLGNFPVGSKAKLAAISDDSSSSRKLQFLVIKREYTNQYTLAIADARHMVSGSAPASLFRKGAGDTFKINPSRPFAEEDLIKWLKSKNFYQSELIAKFNILFKLSMPSKD